MRNEMRRLRDDVEYNKGLLKTFSDELKTKAYRDMEMIKVLKVHSAVKYRVRRLRN